MQADALAARIDAPSLGTVVDGVHRNSLRVYVEDTDAGGVVYHAKYLHFLERARTQFLAKIGFGLSTLMTAESAAWRAFVVRRADISYLRPARLDDVLVSVTRVARVGGASIDFDQRLLRGKNEIAAEISRAMIYVCCVDRTGRPQPIPAAMKSKILEISKLESVNRCQK